jgi:hypothetical protein
MRWTAIALGCGALVLAGCGTDGSTQSVQVDSGQAAVSSEFRVSQAEIADDVALVLSGQGLPPGEPPAGLAGATTERVVQGRLIRSYAEVNGIELTRTQVEQGRAQLATESGGEEALRDLALQNGIPAEAINDVVETQLLLTAIGLSVSGGGDPAVQGEAALGALSEYSAAIDVEVSPRYGTWDDAQLQIVPGSELSTPDSGEQATS